MDHRVPRLYSGSGPASVYFSLTNYNVLEPAEWTGLANYTEILTQDDLFRKSLINTAYYTVIYVPLHIVSALGVAMLLNTRVRGVPFWRTFFYLPSVTCGGYGHPVEVYPQSAGRNTEPGSDCPLAFPHRDGQLTRTG